MCSHRYTIPPFIIITIRMICTTNLAWGALDYHLDEEDHKHPIHESQAGVLLVQLEAFEMQLVIVTDILLCGSRTECLYLNLHICFCILYPN